MGTVKSTRSKNGVSNTSSKSNSPITNLTLTPEQQLQQELSFYQRRHARIKQEIYDSLLNSIKTMRDFLDTAERVVNDQVLTDYDKLESKVNAVMHWGLGGRNFSGK